MRISIEKEIKKIEHAAELDGKVDSNHISAIMQLINAIRYIKHDENIASDLTKELVDKYFINERKESKTMEIEDILKYDDVYFNVTFIHDYGCCISLSLKDSYNDKIFVEYDYAFSTFDARMSPNMAAGLCIKDFLQKYDCLDELKSGKLIIRESSMYTSRRDSRTFEEFVETFKLDL